MKKFVMSLQAKILLIVLAVVGLYAGVDYASQKFFVLPSFVALEQTEAQNTIRRCISTLKREISNLEKSANEWATSDDTCQFVKDPGDNYVRTKLGIDAFTRNKVNLIYFCAADGQVVWGEIRDLETKQKIQLQEFPAGFRPISHPLLGHNSPDASTAGLCITSQGPMLMASSPITSSANTGPSHGTLVIGRFLNDILVKTLAEQTSADFRVWMVADRLMPDCEKEAIGHIKAESQFYMRELSDECLSIYAVLYDIEAAPALLIRVDLPRNIKSGAIAGFIRSNLLSNLTAGLIVLLVLWVLLRNTVVGPISRLTRHVTAIGNSCSSTSLLPLNRRDEIGALAREFDRMVQQLAESRRKLSEQCYNLGKAEVAAGVLHNARNVLTPLVTRIGSLREKLHEVPLEKIERAQAELDQAHDSPARKEDLIEVINLSCMNLAAFVHSTKENLDDIARLLSQVEEMLDQQGKFSHAQLPAEQVRLDELLRDSIALLPRDVAQELSIKMDPSVKTIEPMMAHSITILQVFNNVLLNAAESICRTGSAPGNIHIRASAEKVDGAQMVDVRISDNGEGIEPANLDHIFERGFSTKHNIPSGIGLHWCANAVSMMNGQIYAESSGKGHGACFHILLPVSRNANCLLNETAGARS
jgi:signal transduction histidine kinase